MYTSFNFTRPQMQIRPHYARPSANPVSHQSQSLTFGIGVGQDRKGIYFEDDGGRKHNIKWDDQQGRHYGGDTFLSQADEAEYARLRSEARRSAQEIGDDASSESSAVKPSSSKDKKKKGLMGWGKTILKEAVEGGSKGAAEGLVKERGAELLSKVVPRRRHDHNRQGNYGPLGDRTNYPDDLEFDDDAGDVAGRMGAAALTGYVSNSHSSDDNGFYRTRMTNHDATGLETGGSIIQGRKQREHIQPGSGRRRSTNS